MSDTPTSALPPAAPYDAVPDLVTELSLPERSVRAVVRLLEEGATVPFIARYRKEVTGGLDEVQIRDIQERQSYLMELETRRQAIRASIAEQGKLTPELDRRISACTTKAALEDLYLPYKKKRRTRAAIAKERGLEPLAELLLAQPLDDDPQRAAARFVDPAKEVPDVDVALRGARDIVAERIAEHAEVRAMIRQAFAEDGVLHSKKLDDVQQPTKFEQYYDFAEKVATVPSHRFLAIRRGENENVLRAWIEVDEDALLGRMERYTPPKNGSPFAGELRTAIREAYRRLIAPSVETDVRVELKLRSDRGAVDVFADNLRNLLLSAPLGGKAVIGIDPGLRTGCKCVAVDATGKFLEHVTLQLAISGRENDRARDDLLAFVRKHAPAAIAIGNGTGGRETESVVRKMLAEHGLKQIMVVAVNEAGASIYSASDIAREEFPDLDLTVRGAISIARRLQDPLAELVKIEPKSIGVGQYQHDVSQVVLGRKLTEVVESCVNHVGVELNTASSALLSYVAGIGPSVAKGIVAHREARGRFGARQELLKVPGLGPRAFEQCAGFLRVREGEHPLDASAVHPERYALVERIAKDMNIPLSELVGNADHATRIPVDRYVGDGVGKPTLDDIVSELRKPGRDPRDTFDPPTFREDVNTLQDLKEDMWLEGVVTNVTAFGAFVDVGVHQDGLVHVSQLADRFVRDPKEVVSVGDKLRVRVVSVDLPRKRIALSARVGDGTNAGGARGARQENAGTQETPRGKGGGGRPQNPPLAQRFSNNPFAALAPRKPS